MVSASKLMWDSILSFGGTDDHTNNELTVHSIGTTSPSLGNTAREEAFMQQKNACGGGMG